MLSYRTDYPNQVHQIVVSVSKHLHITKTGRVKYQKKSLDVDLQSVETSDKEHVLVYMVRDHCSGAIYCDVARSSQILPVATFLLRAWSRKPETEFCGVPESVTLPRKVVQKFPEVPPLLDYLGVQIIDVTSGFQGGVIGIKDLDVRLLQWATAPIATDRGFLRAGDPDFDKLRSQCCEVISYVNDKPARTGKESKLDMWRQGVKGVRLPPHHMFRDQ